MKTGEPIASQSWWVNPILWSTPSPVHLEHPHGVSHSAPIKNWRNHPCNLKSIPGNSQQNRHFPTMFPPFSLGMWWFLNHSTSPWAPKSLDHLQTVKTTPFWISSWTKADSSKTYLDSPSRSEGAIKDDKRSVWRVPIFLLYPIDPYVMGSRLELRTDFSQASYSWAANNWGSLVACA